MGFRLGKPASAEVLNIEARIPAERGCPNLHGVCGGIFAAILLKNSNILSIITLSVSIRKKNDRKKRIKFARTDYPVSADFLQVLW